MLEALNYGKSILVKEWCGAIRQQAITWTNIDQDLQCLMASLGHNLLKRVSISQIAKFMGPTWGPPGSCRPQMGPMLVPWTLLSGYTDICTLPPCLYKADNLNHEWQTHPIIWSIWCLLMTWWQQHWGYQQPWWSNILQNIHSPTCAG